MVLRISWLDTPSIENTTYCQQYIHPMSEPGKLAYLQRCVVHDSFPWNCNLQTLCPSSLQIPRPTSLEHCTATICVPLCDRKAPVQDCRVHELYGPIVRISPNELIFNLEESWQGSKCRPFASTRLDLLLVQASLPDLDT